MSQCKGYFITYIHFNQSVSKYCKTSIRCAELFNKIQYKFTIKVLTARILYTNKVMTARIPSTAYPPQYTHYRASLLSCILYFEHYKYQLKISDGINLPLKRILSQNESFPKKTCYTSTYTSIFIGILLLPDSESVYC